MGRSSRFLASRFSQQTPRDGVTRLLGDDADVQRDAAATSRRCVPSNRRWAAGRLTRRRAACDPFMALN